MLSVQGQEGRQIFLHDSKYDVCLIVDRRERNGRNHDHHEVAEGG